MAVPGSFRTRNSQPLAYRRRCHNEPEGRSESASLVFRFRPCFARKTLSSFGNGNNNRRDKDVLVVKRTCGSIDHLANERAHGTESVLLLSWKAHALEQSASPSAVGQLAAFQRWHQLRQSKSFITDHARSHAARACCGQRHWRRSGRNDHHLAGVLRRTFALVCAKSS